MVTSPLLFCPAGIKGLLGRSSALTAGGPCRYRCRPTLG